MIVLGIKEMKASFFDPSIVLRAEEQARERDLIKAGAFVRRRARSSIRPGGKKGKVSAPGEPPRSHVGTLKRMIFFARDRQIVIVGPALFNQSPRAARAHPTVPNVLEYGGLVLFPGRPAGKTYPALPAYSRKIEARPFMDPALAAEAPKFPGLWRNSIKSSI